MAWAEVCLGEWWCDCSQRPEEFFNSALQFRDLTNERYSRVPFACRALCVVPATFPGTEKIQ